MDIFIRHLQCPGCLFCQFDQAGGAADEITGLPGFVAQQSGKQFSQHQLTRPSAELIFGCCIFRLALCEKINSGKPAGMNSCQPADLAIKNCIRCIAVYIDQNKPLIGMVQEVL